MVSWTSADQIAYETRRKVNSERLEVLEGCEKEAELHNQICDHCDKQWPKWKYIHARMDKRSTVEVGAQDFTIFMPAGRTLCIECKAKSKKLRPDQLAWKLEMERLGHQVHTIRNFDEFLNLLTPPQNDNSTMPEQHHVRD